MVQHFMEEMYASFLINTRDFRMWEDQGEVDKTFRNSVVWLKEVVYAMGQNKLNTGSIAKRVHFESVADISKVTQTTGKLEIDMKLSKQQQNEDHTLIN